MKVYELQTILNCHDPTADVVIATMHDRAYFNFKVEKRVGTALTEGHPLVVLEVTDEVGLTVVPV
jgi:hypothetical protein